MNNIFQTLKELQKNSHCIYSKYPVSAILIDDNNNSHIGVNVENASYGLTMCAERSALFSAVSNGHKHFKEVHILCGNNVEEFGTPCGACRQILAEFMDDDANVVIWNCKGDKKIFTISELIPGCFKNNFLEKK